MRIGISITSSYQTKDVRDGARQMINRANAAALAGLDSLFVGDHHVVPTPYYQNTPMMGRLLAEWDSRDAGALFLLPLWNPVLAAEQIATLACIAQGKFIMQCGLGAGRQQFNAMGANIKHRPSSFEQAIECMRALWAGESVTMDGRWTFEGARICPLPPLPIEIWIGASAPVAIERAARIGDAWLADPGLTLEQAARALEQYNTALAAFGRANPTTVAIRRDIYVAESAADAQDTLALITSQGYRGFDPEALIIGTSEDVASQFQAFGELGFTDIIIRNLHRDPDKAIASTVRLAQVREFLNS